MRYRKRKLNLKMNNERRARQKQKKDNDFPMTRQVKRPWWEEEVDEFRHSEPPAKKKFRAYTLPQQTAWLQRFQQQRNYNTFTQRKSYNGKQNTQQFKYQNVQNVNTYNNNNYYTNKFRARNQTQQYQNSNYQRSFRRIWNEDRRQKHVHERYPAHSNSNSNYWTRYVNTKNSDERKNMNMNMNRKENQE